MPSFEQMPIKKPESQEVPVIELSDEEVENLEKADPKEVMKGAVAEAEKDERRKELVRKILANYESLIPETPDKGQRIKKAEELIKTPEFRKKLAIALTAYRNLDPERSAGAFSQELLRKINNPEK